MRKRRGSGKSAARALAMACAATLPAAIVRADSTLDEYSFTNDSFNATVVVPNLVSSVFSYVNANPGDPPLNNPPFIGQAGVDPDDPPFYVAQGDWYPTTYGANENYYQYNVSVAPGYILNAGSFSYYVNSRQGVLFDSQVTYSTDPTFDNPVNFDASPFLIAATNTWSTYTAIDTPIVSGSGTYYFRIYSQIDPNGSGTISDLLNMSNISLIGQVQQALAPTNMYWDPAGVGTFGSGGSGTWIGSNTWADGAIDYPWSNTISEIANFGGTAAGVVMLGGDVTAAGINFNTAGYNITGTAGQTLTLTGPITANADGTISAALTNTGAAALVKSGTGALTIAGTATFIAGTALNIDAGTLGVTSGGSVTANGANQLVAAISGNTGTLIVQGTGSFKTDSALVLANQGGNGTLNVLGSGFVSARSISVAAGTSGIGTVNQSGGIVTAGSVNLASGGASSATYNLNGGVLSTFGVFGGGGVSNFNFNGGTLQVTGHNTNVFTGITNLQVQNGGAVIDTNNQTVFFAQSLVPAAGSTGGLTKIGAGNLIFGGFGTVNVTYNADSLINVEAGLLTGSSSYEGIWTSNLASLNIATGAVFDAVEAGPTGAMQIDALTGGGTFQGGFPSNPGGGLSMLTIGAANGSGTFSGIIQNDAGSQVAVVKTGSGTETFSGSNTYTGSTAVKSGTLKLIATPVPSSAISISSGAVLEYNDSTRTYQTATTYTGTGTLRKTGTDELIFGVGKVNVNFSSGALIDVEGGELVGSDGHGGIWTSNQASLNIASGATFDAVEAGATGKMQIDALTGGGTLTGGYSGNTGALTTITIGVAGGSGAFSGQVEDDLHAHLAIVKTGSGTETFSGSNTYTGSTAINNGLFIVGANTAIPTAGALSIGTGTTAAAVQFATNIGTVAIPSLTLQSASKLDISNNALAINFASPSADPIAGVLSALTAGYNGGAWTGTSGIVSTIAAAGGTSTVLSVGYADGNTDPGAGAAANQVLIKYTLAGDANLDGKVDFTDLGIVGQHLNTTGNDWAHGNFTYSANGTVNFTDLGIVGQNLNQQTPAVAALGAPAQLLDPIAQGNTAVVLPEPAAIFALVPFAAALLTRRRRRSAMLPNRRTDG